MAVMQAMKPEGSYAYEIADTTGLPVDKVGKALSNLVRTNSVLRVKIKGKDRLNRYMVNPQAHLPSDVMEALLGPVVAASDRPLLKVVNQAAMWNRLGRVKRLRDRLIEEHWELLDEVIKDYELTMHAGDKEEPLNRVSN